MLNNRLPAETLPYASVSFWLTPGQKRVTAWLGSGLLALAALLFSLQVPNLTLDAGTVLAWLLCLGLFTLADLLAGPLEHGIWARYLNLAAMVALLALGNAAALGVVLLGVVLAALLRRLLGSWLRLTPMSLRQNVETALGRACISGYSVLLASALYQALNGVLPLTEFQVSHTPALAVALLGAIAATQFLGYLLALPDAHAQAHAVWPVRKLEHVLPELLLLVIVAPFALALHRAGVGVFATFMGMAVLLALRYQQVNQTQADLEARVQELSLLNHLVQTISASLMLEELLHSIANQVSGLVDATTVVIGLYNDSHDRLEFPLVVKRGQPQAWLPHALGDDPLSYIVQHKTGLHLTAANEAQLAQLNHLITEAPPYVSLVGVPLVVGTKILGVMAVLSDQRPHGFSASERSVLLTVASQAGLAIRNATLYTQRRELVQNLSLINSAIQNVIFSLDTEQVLAVACETALTVSKAQKATLFVWDAEAERAHLVHSIGLTEEQRGLFDSLPYHPQRHELGPYIVSDTRELVEDAPWSVLHQQEDIRALIEAPLRSGNVVRGFLGVYYSQPYYHRPTDLDLLETLANQVTAAVDNAELLQALEGYAAEMAQLVHLSRISTSTLELDRIADDIADIVCEMMRVSRATIALYTPGAEAMRIVGVSRVGRTSFPGVEETVWLDTFPEVQALRQTPLAKAQCYHRDDPHLSDALRTLMATHTEATLAIVPVTSGNQLSGVMLLGSQQRKTFSDGEWQLIETAANQIAAQIQNAQLYSNTQAALNRRLEQLGLIEQIARQISSTFEFNQIISNVLEAAMRATQADLGSLGLLTSADEFWVINQNYVEGVAQKTYRAQGKHEGVMGQVAQTGRAMIVPDNREVPSYVAPPVPTAYLSSLAVPIIRDGAVAAVLNVESVQPNFFTEEQASFLRNLADHAMISIENARLLAEHQYQIETLTALRGLALRLSTAVGALVLGTAQAVLETALQMLQGEMGVIFQYVDNQVSFVTALPADTTAAVEAHMALFTAVAYQAAQAGEVQVMTDVKDRTELPANVTPCASMIAVPLKRGNRVRDVLCVAFRERRDFQERELNTIDLLANQAAGHLENATLHEQVRAGNNRMRAILDSTRDGVILLDANERLIEANASAEHLLGIGLTDYIGEHFVTMLLRYTEPDAAGQSRDDIVHMARLLRLEPERITRRQFERKTPTEHLYIEEVGSPVRDINNQIHGRLLVLRDITEEKLLEAYRDEITNMAIHDLRGPLASIISGLGLVLQDLQEGDQQASAETTLALVLESAEGLMALVDSMMDIAKLETRQMLLQRGAISLPQLVENAFMALVSSIQAAEVKVQIDLPTDLPLIYVDGDKIRRVLINLLDNAVRHSPNGGDILIEASLLAKEQRILVRIADSGPGIPLGERERIFEKFTQLQGDAHRRGRRGTGLGLTFCKLAVEAHGERIWVEPKSPLAGACFALTLPVAETPPQQSALSSEHVPQTAETGMNP